LSFIELMKRFFDEAGLNFNLKSYEYGDGGDFDLVSVNRCLAKAYFKKNNLVWPDNSYAIAVPEMAKHLTIEI